MNKDEYNKIFKIIRRTTGYSNQEIEDSIHDVCVTALEHKKEFENENHRRSYYIGRTKFKLLDNKKTYKHFHKKMDMYYSELEIEKADPGQVESVSIVEKIEKLNKNRKNILTLYSKMELEEVCKKLNMKRSTLISNIRHIRNELKD